MGSAPLQRVKEVANRQKAVYIKDIRKRLLPKEKVSAKLTDEGKYAGGGTPPLRDGTKAPRRERPVCRSEKPSPQGEGVTEGDG